MNISEFDLSPYINQGLLVLGNVVVALLIFWIGKAVAKRISYILDKAMERSKLDDTLRSFLSSCIFGVLMMMIIIASLNKIGVDTTSLIAIVGGAAVAIGLALKDQLSNFAAGILIILTRPFNRGDYVLVDGDEGTVYEISLLATSLMTANNHEVTIPNSHMITKAVTNFSSLPNRRVDITVGISYNADIRSAKEVLLTLTKNHELVFSDPKPAVMVVALNDSSVDLSLRLWTANTDWLKVRSDLYEEIKYAFDENKIEIPFPQQVIHMVTEK